MCPLSEEERIAHPPRVRYTNITEEDVFQTCTLTCEDLKVVSIYMKKSDCPFDPAAESYPKELFTDKQIKMGGVVLYIFGKVVY